MTSPDLSSTSSYLRESDGLIDHVLQQVRHISLDLRPSMLDDLGLVASVRWQLDRTARLAGFAGHFTANPPEIRLPPEIGDRVLPHRAGGADQRHATRRGAAGGRRPVAAR